MVQPVLSVRDLRVEFVTRRGVLKAIDGISFDIGKGEVLGVVGESGAGKSVTGSAVVGLIDPPGRIAGGEILLSGMRIDNLPPEEMRKVRGKRIGMIFQDPLTSLNPLYRVGEQLVETIQTHTNLSGAAARKRAIDLLAEVGIPAPERRIDGYPHEFSGGMRQRVMIAMALSCGPELLIADEPTTALDVTIQAQVLALLEELGRELGLALLLITHDLSVLASTCDRIAVMYAGRIVETGATDAVFSGPAMPYTEGLMASIARVDQKGQRLNPIVGAPPNLARLPSGCPFHPRCLHREKVPGDLCRTELPALVPGGRGPNHTKRCHLADPDAVFEAYVAPVLDGKSVPATAPETVPETVPETAPEPLEER